MIRCDVTLIHICVVARKCENWCENKGICNMRHDQHGTRRASNNNRAQKGFQVYNVMEGQFNAINQV